MQVLMNALMFDKAKIMKMITRVQSLLFAMFIEQSFSKGAHFGFQFTDQHLIITSTIYHVYG